MATPQNILDGIRVLDFSQALAGPTTTRLMAEMGAEVIKVELAPNGEASRALPYLRNGRSGYYIQQNRGKKSIAIDRKDPRSVELVMKVLEKCDVLVENFAPGAIGRLGFGWDVVHKVNPRLIMGSISAFGQTGPLASLPGYDYIGAAYAGVLSMIGEADGPPYFYMLGIGDVMTGTHLLAAINGALFYRERTGRGQYVEASLLDSYFHCHEVNVQAHTASGGEIKPFRCGAHHYAVSPLGVFKCREGYVIIAVLPNQWPNFCNALGKPELVNDPRFVDGPARIANRDALNALIEQALARYPTAIDAAEDWGLQSPRADSTDPDRRAGGQASTPGRTRNHTHGARPGVWQLPGAGHAAALFRGGRVTPICAPPTWANTTSTCSPSTRASARPRCASSKRKARWSPSPISERQASVVGAVRSTDRASSGFASQGIDRRNVPDHARTDRRPRAVLRRPRLQHVPRGPRAAGG
jgi:crotonobetainyl-CoA:carnitine CoA-transferase CaiB-like acyl-CoA transferase